MKKFAYLWLAGCLIGIAPSLLKAQEYHPMAVEGAHWIVIFERMQTLWRDGKYSFTVRGDTIVNGKEYKKVYREFFEFDDETKYFTNRIIHSELYAIIRDDVTQRKVFCIKGETYYDYYDSCPTNEEYLLFDFSVKEGDTLDWCSIEFYRRMNADGISRADSIRLKSSYFSDIPRRTVNTKFGWSSYGDRQAVNLTVPIIEGIGYEIIGPFLEGSFLMDYCVGTNADCGLITSKRNIQRPSLRVFPNPAKEVLIIEGEGTNGWDFNNPFFLRVDLTGKVVKEQKLQSGQYGIDIAHIPAGFYLCRLINNNGIIYQTSFVKE